ncbi:uncharacterized protein [Pseudorasbora parva]|uniref:uncharacterized protein n=1 Tax=Pseudorasbora parva TaxID=51549 RepID=UPI00351E301C
MTRKGLVVRNVPPLHPAPTCIPQSSTRVAERATPDAERAPATLEPEPESVSDDSSEEYYQSSGGPNWTSDVRVEMGRKGLYKKHSIAHPLLQGFYVYLSVDLGNKRSKQEVENVSRFMFFMDPNEPSLSFVPEVEKVREYFNVLTHTQLAKQTVLNYWKSLKRFMRYTITSTSLQSKDKTLYMDCKDFIDPLDGIRAGMSKKVNKELTQKRYRGYGKEKLPADCVAILDLAKTDFLALIGKLQGPEAVSGELLEKRDRLLIRYYLEAIIMLKLLQRPGVVTNMTVEEWQGRTRFPEGSCIAVKEHKTAASQIAEVPLTTDQDLWFSLYFNHIRPVMLQGSRSGDDATAEGQFCVSSSGRPIHNPCNDLYRLHAKYKIPPVSSGDARMAFETAAKNLPEVERNAVARLLGHTPETAEKHYRMRTPADAFLAQRLVENITGKTQSECAASTSRGQPVYVSDVPPPKRAGSECAASTSREQRVDASDSSPPIRARRDPYKCFVMLHRLPQS